jgi:integrase
MKKCLSNQIIDLEPEYTMLTIPLMQIIRPSNGGICMKGSIQLWKGVKYPYWRVHFYYLGKDHTFDYYLNKNCKMYQMHREKDKDEGYRTAQKLLAMIQADYERALRGEGTFNIRHYKDQKTDVIPYLEQWLEIVLENIMPGTLKSYRTAVKIHLIPFFERHPLQMHEIGKDTILLLMREMECSPKHKFNVVNVLKAAMKLYAESNRNFNLPVFPKKKEFKIEEKLPQWITAERQERIMQKIPEEHQSIFRWLQYHWRREGEAIALRKTDYSKEYDAFSIQHGISNCTLVNREKTGRPFRIPCHPLFKPYMNNMHKTLSPFFFTWEGSECEGKRYSPNKLRRIWNEACNSAGERIDIHRGLRTSSASSAINEAGWSVEEVQKYGNWHDRKTIETHYADYELERVRQLQARVIPLQSRGKKVRR